MKYSFTIIVLCLFFFFEANSQQAVQRLDSLRNQLNNESDPEEMAWIHGRLAYQYYILAKVDSALYHAEEVFKVAGDKDVEAKILAWGTFANKKMQDKEYDEAESFLLKAESILPIDNYNLQYIVYYNLLRLSIFRNDQEAIFDYERKTLEVCRKHRPYKRWSVYEKIGNMYADKKQYKKAEEYLIRAYNVTKKRARRKDHGFILYFLKQLADKQNDAVKSAMYAKEMEELLGDSSQAKTLHAGSSYDQKELFNLSVDSLYKLKVEAEKVGFREMIWNVNFTLAEKLADEQLYTEAHRISSQLLELHGPKVKEPLRYALLKFMYDNAKNLNDDELIRKQADLLVTFQDTMITYSNNELIMEMEVRYENTEQKEEIALLKANERIATLEINSANTQKKILGLVGLALACILSGLFYYYREKSKSNTLLEEKNKIIAKNLADKEVLLKEIHHRVKNNLQVISSLLSLQSRTELSPSAAEALNEGQSRVQSMALIHQYLMKGETLSSIDLPDYIGNLCRIIFASHSISADKVKLILDVESVELDVNTLVPLGLILNELITNACKYAFPGDRTGHLKISLQEKKDVLVLNVKDNGIGRREDSDTKQSGFGSKLVRIFSKKLESDTHYDYSDGTSVNMEIKRYKMIS